MKPNKTITNYNAIGSGDRIGLRVLTYSVWKFGGFEFQPSETNDL